MSGTRKNKSKPLIRTDAGKFLERGQLELHKLGLGSYRALDGVLDLVKAGERFELIEGSMHVYREGVTFLLCGGASEPMAPIPFCPYIGCELSRTESFTCDHAREEMEGGSSNLSVASAMAEAGRTWTLRDEIVKTYFPNGTCTFRGIRFVMDLVASRRGIYSRRTVNGQSELLESIGRDPFYDQETGLFVRRTRTGSRSFSIMTTDTAFEWMSCENPTCDKEGIAQCSVTGSFSCGEHRRDENAIVRFGGSGPAAKLKQALLRKVMRAGADINTATEDDWVEGIKYLHSLGDRGFCSDDYEERARINLYAKIGMIATIAHNKSYSRAVCVMLGCTGTLFGARRDTSKSINEMFPVGRSTSYGRLAVLTMCSAHAHSRAGKAFLRRLVQELNEEQYGSVVDQVANYPSSYNPRAMMAEGPICWHAEAAKIMRDREMEKTVLQQSLGRERIALTSMMTALQKFTYEQGSIEDDVDEACESTTDEPIPAVDFTTTDEEAAE